MHLPTYLILMGSAILYGVVRAVELWLTNKLLFAVSVFTTLVTLTGALMQSVNADDFEFKWMLWYLIPVGLLLLGGILGINELQDAALSKVGVQPPSHVLPGVSSDYKHAAWGHFASMLFPIAAALFAKLVHFGLNSRNTAKRVVVDNGTALPTNANDR